jgi:hypothetical protein
LALGEASLCRSELLISDLSRFTVSGGAC